MNGGKANTDPQCHSDGARIGGRESRFVFAVTQRREIAPLRVGRIA